MCVLEYMWHVMVHCKHSRLAKALSDQSHSTTARPFPGEATGCLFPHSLFGGASFGRASQSGGRGRTAGQPCNEGEGSSCPLFLHSHVCGRHFFSLLAPPPALQPVHPERVLGGRVGEHHVRVIEHVQSVQGERVDLQLVQWELRVRVEADITDARQRVGELFGKTGWRLTCD